MKTDLFQSCGQDSYGSGVTFLTANLIVPKSLCSVQTPGSDPQGHASPDCAADQSGFLPFLGTRRQFLGYYIPPISMLFAHCACSAWKSSFFYLRSHLHHQSKVRVAILLHLSGCIERASWCFCSCLKAWKQGLHLNNRIQHQLGCGVIICYLIGKNGHYCFHFVDKKTEIQKGLLTGTSLTTQWLRYSASKAGCMSSVLGQS